MQNRFFTLIPVLLLAGTGLYAGTGMAESASGFLTSLPPGAPELSSPADGAENLPDTVTVVWHSRIHTASYTLQVSEAADFGALFTEETLTDTMYLLPVLSAGTTYHWRIRGNNVAGEGCFSSAWDFSTLVPLPGIPVLLAPLQDAVDVPVDTELKWQTVADAISYRLQVSLLPDFSTFFVNQAELPDTLYSLSELDHDTFYHWRVSASNVAGESEFSEARQFTTASPSSVREEADGIPRRYALLPVYPNPFNPSVTITYEIPEASEVTLTLYNGMGQEVRRLAFGLHMSGKYNMKWDGRDSRGAAVPSGLYLCRLESGGRVCTQKMLLMR